MNVPGLSLLSGYRREWVRADLVAGLTLAAYLLPAGLGDAALAGLETKKQRVDAAMVRARRLGWPNIYTYTKALSEHILAARDDLRVTTVRPAIVECAWRYPFPGWNEGINTSGPILWLLSTSFQRFPARATNFRA